jgi:hypothetical protein
MPLLKKVYQGKIRKNWEKVYDHKIVPNGYELLGRGAEGIIFKNLKTGKVLKFAGLPVNAGREPIKRYYYHKIASLIFPDQVLEYSLAVNGKNLEKQSSKDQLAAVYESKQINITEMHKKINDDEYTVWMQDKKNRIARFSEKARRMGIYFDDFSVNVDFINNTLFMFEVGGIDIHKLEFRLNRIEDPIKRKKIKIYIDRIKRLNELENQVWENL